jgi:3-deoxy-D-manno-octulosonic-acid transferase
MYFLYSVLLATALLLGLPYWGFEMIRHGKYWTSLRERLGWVPSRIRQSAAGEGCIWVHAVSVGEVLAVSGLVEFLGRRFPDHWIVVSTTTDTGQKLARKRFGETNVFYFPMDFGFAIRPYLQALHPRLVVIAETELWPNFLREAHKSGATIAVVNARISDRSWPSYRRFRALVRRILENVDLLLAQTDQDRQRLESIGAAPGKIRVTGNLKFDIPPAVAPPITDGLRKSLHDSGAGQVLICGSTVEGEEALLAKAFQHVLATHRRSVMILAPRHPERFERVASLLQAAGLPWWRRSDWKEQPLAGGVLLLDTIGELASLYSVADIAFVGGSLVPRGGHNIIEPAQYGVAIVVGKHTENFRDIVSSFQSSDAVRIVGQRDLADTFLELLGNDQERRELGQRAARLLTSQSGATLRTAEALEELLAMNSSHLGSTQSVRTE